MATITLHKPMATAAHLFCAAAVCSALCAALRYLWSKRAQYDGLDSLVSFSARQIAAARAVETEEEDCVIVRDYLAQQLAGRQAMQLMNERLRKIDALYDAAAAQKEMGVALKRRYKVSRIGLRTRWFDQTILNTLTDGRHPLPVSVNLSITSANMVRVQLTLRPTATQVVQLAAGMDARAWRLPFPTGTRMYELDKPDVAAAKRKVLAKLNAQTSRHTQPPAKGCLPLTCSQWHLLPCDLTDSSWTSTLQHAGWNPQQPTVWVAEGLLMYLTLHQVEALISSCAGLSSPGSVFVTGWNQGARLHIAQTSSSNLARQWKSGYPANVREFFYGCGWSSLIAASAHELVTQFQREVPGFQFAERRSTDSTPYMVAAR